MLLNILKVLTIVVVFIICVIAIGLASGFYYLQDQMLKREVQTAKILAPQTGKFVKADDVELYVQELGSATGQPIVFIHGFGAWSETWKPSMKALADLGFHTVAIDLPPFGFSGKPGAGKYTRTAQAKRIGTLLQSMGLQKVTLVGHSFGGGATIETALQYPDIIRQLVLVDVALGLGDGTVQPPETIPDYVLNVIENDKLRDVAVGSTLTNPMFTKELLKSFVYKKESITPEWVALYQKPLSQANSSRDLGIWLKDFFTVEDMSPSTKESSYANLKQQTLIVWGKEDTVTPLAEGEYLLPLFEHGGIQVMPGVGHIPQIEDTEGFNKILVEYIKSGTDIYGVSTKR